MTKYSKEELRSIFQHPFNWDDWSAIVKYIFRAKNLRIKPELFSSPEDPEQGFYMGNLETPDHYRIGVFYYKIEKGSVAHKKVGLRNLVKRFINQNWGEFDAALVVFDDKKEWRLSFVCDIKDIATAPKRFTFVFGENDNFYRTAIDRFEQLQGEEATFDNIRKAFSVEALSDDFFIQYRNLYADFVEFITGKRYVKEGSKWEEKVIHRPDSQFMSTFECDDKLVRDYVKKMFGRIVFLYFLQRKGWLNGNRHYMHDLYVDSDKKDNFLDGVLEPLFFGVLNEKPENRTNSARNLPGCENIPYLNGGLFANDEIDDRTCVFPEKLFKALFDFLDSYNFTIDENDSDDAEIGIDPEMLGRIFENLLEDNKDKGAFYTPKEIVDFMCKESIIAYLQNDATTEEGRAALRRFVETLDGDNLSVGQRIYIRDRLKTVKICDPAIGSGAFPMGLVNLLSKLYQSLHLSTEFAKIKRHIMEQNIYGVDIEKGAVDIARLRFWLAMIVEEKEPMPLPNLHFKIMQGNSLLESYEDVNLSDLTKVGGQTNLFDSDDLMRTDLKNALRSYYNASDHTKRDRLFEGILKNVTTQLYDKGVVLPKGMDPSANSVFFLWHTWFTDVFENGGFDIVIGNPPYIQLQKSIGITKLDKKGKEYDVKLGDLYKEEGYETFAKTGDIYGLFYEQGWKLLKKGGHLCFITSNKWMRAGYGEPLRGFFGKKTNPELLIDFGGIQIFENATVDTNILLFSKKDNNKKTISVTGNKTSKDILNNLSDFVRQNGTEAAFTASESWVILSPIEQSIKRKIEAAGVPLKDWDIQINYGIKTGFNDAFIISTEKRNEILANCTDDDERHRTEELIRPILRGRDIKRYGYDWADLWLINTHNGIKGKLERIHIEDYPAVKVHLDQYWDKLSKRADKGDTPYNLRNCAYLDDFSKPKIMYPNMTKFLPFYYDEKGFYQNDKSFMVTGQHVAFLTAFFNSSLFKWCFIDNFPELQGGTRELRKIFFDKIPVKKVNTHIEKDFAEIIRDIQYEFTKEKAQRIDKKIFELYELSEEEQKTIGYVEIK